MSLAGIATADRVCIEGRYIDNGRIVCPWHFGAFDVMAGKVKTGTPPG
jgi:nitrite reductase/ring-hydroxylating ferredoxin subunit